MRLRMTLVFAITFCLSACIQTENSSSLDGDSYGTATGSPEFIAARLVFLQNCNGCHAYHTQTEAQLIAQGLAVAGNPEGSKLFYRLAGSSGASGPKNMPTGGTLSNDDLTAVFTWLQNIQ
jgi:mono/diheme cytochrome c family protein